jgi:hypothetical protein
VNKSAIDAANISLAKAETFLAAMRIAKNYAELKDAWSDFLLACGRIYSKLEQGAKTNGQSIAWFGRKKHERRNDPLLKYIHHARNIDEHGLTDITRLKPKSVGIGSSGSTYVKLLEINDGKITKAETSGDPLIVSHYPESAYLVSVVDRGDKYDPPNEHMGKPLADTSPIAVAELAVVYLRSIISDASKLPV